MDISILTSKGQLVIPKRIRGKYGMKGGVKIIFEETKDGVLMKPMNEDYFNSFVGILKSGDLKQDMQEMREEESVYENKKMNPSKSK